MKKIIDGKLYDTENAELICSAESGIIHIYKTKKGNWFKYNYISIFNEKIIDCIIQPLSEEDAKQEISITDIGKYIELFGEPEEA